MKTVILSLFLLFSLSSASSIKEVSVVKEYDAIKLDCHALAQGYYEYLVKEEKVENREVGRRARVLFDQCKKATK